MRHTGDFKIDTTPIQGGMMDLARLGELGKEGVLALLCDSTNVERPGYTRSERSVGASFDALFRGCEERIIVTTFASNVDRIQQIIDVAARYGRKVAVTGRSMENAMKVSTELGYMNIPDGTLMDLNQIKSLPKNRVCIITTGSQGEDHVRPDPDGLQHPPAGGTCSPATGSSSRPVPSPATRTPSATWSTSSTAGG